MTLSKETKAAIQAEYDEWKDSQYSGKDKKERQSKGQFFTPPQLTIKMLEKFDTLKDKDILDPTAGAGGLIAAAVIAGANPRRCYGIELDPDIAVICRKRLAKLGVPERHVKVANALDPQSYDFQEEPKIYVEISKWTDKIEFVFVSDFKEVKSVEYALPSDNNKATSLIVKLKEKKVKIFKKTFN